MIFFVSRKASNAPLQFFELSFNQSSKTWGHFETGKVKERMKVKTFILAIIGWILMAGTMAEAAVWQTTQEWDVHWEARYQEWVSREWDKNFFLRPGGLMEGSQVDCADAVYTMRAYFASLNGLPFAIKDPTTRRAEAVISNSMSRWDSQPQLERVRRFIKLLYSVGSTATLPNDSYPTAIGPATLHAGSFILTDRANHHSWTIRLFSQTGIPHLIYASRPAKPILFERKDYPSMSFVFPNGIRAETNAGFRNFRYPEDIGRPVHEVPGFSLEQYDISPRGFMRSVQKRMQNVAETHEARVSRLLVDACSGVSERVEAVRLGVARNLELGSTCMNATEYDDHSTPSRDSRLKASLEDLAASYQEGLNARALSSEMAAKLKSVVSGAGPANASMPCAFEVSPGKTLSLGQVYKAIIADKLSNNPHDTLEMRWGLARFPSSKAKSCPVY